MGIRLLTRDGHDGDSKEGGCAADDIEDGEACVSSGSTREQEAEQVHEWNHSPPIEQQQKQHIYQVTFFNKGLHPKCTEHHLKHRWRTQGKKLISAIIYYNRNQNDWGYNLVRCHISTDDNMHCHSCLGLKPFPFRLHPTCNYKIWLNAYHLLCCYEIISVICFTCEQSWWLGTSMYMLLFE